MKKIFLSLLLLSFLMASGATLVFAQNPVIDSLKTVLSIERSDTTRVNLLNIISRDLMNIGDYEPSMEYATQAETLARKVGFKKGIASSYSNIGSIQYNKGEYDKAIEFYLKSLKIWEELNAKYPNLENKKGMASCWNNIGNIYYRKGDYDKTLIYYLRSLKIREEISMVNKNDLGNKKGMAATYGNVGMIHSDKGDYNKGLEFFLKSIKIKDEIGDKHGMAASLNNIGTIHRNKGEYDKALEYYLKSLKIREEADDKYGMAASWNNIGYISKKQNKNLKSRESYQKSLAIAKEIGAKPEIMDAYLGLTEADSALGNFKSAFENHKLFMAYKDSVHNAESEKKMLQTEMQHEYEKKEAVAKAEQEKKDAIAAEELEKQKMQRNGFVGGFALMMVLAGVSYRSFRNKRKANEIISHQKHLVEEKQKEILDSINYAKRIQDAILPSRYSLTENLKNGFVLFKPKDVVSGDFYWLEKFEDKIYFAAADCTGHGVPGAMVSVICANALSKALLEERIMDPGKLLDRTRELVIERFAKSGEDVKDGMDISLCCLLPSPAGERPRVKLQWAGANNPLWIVRKKELLEFRPDKQPIGKYAEEKPFTTNSIDLQTDDSLYIFTDGYADQFGGEQGKKFKYAKLKELLLTIQHEKMDRQKEILNETFETWRGNLEQVDDVCIIGIRI